MLNKLAQLFSRSPKPVTPEKEPEKNSAETAEEADERVFARDERDTQSWVGVGLDGVLAERLEERYTGEIGPPIPDMVARIKDWVKYKGIKVRVLTPRASTQEGADQVRIWLETHHLSYLECTHAKDLHMVEFWDDRAVQVISNLGTSVGESPAGLDPAQRPMPTDIPETPDATGLTK
ncbi:hypothetical protein [Cerasicoccus arenae]|uniref:Uncharacterized protein n=1 Tax=Cerasicoccus arenae TaxID=424488 RepID=A0A8J3DHD7_9BACT|nr:hypothetical protein [Cerasicoccus arenae]MBK1859680.1 hypothetical protein [Cerasicoccus arenae]GHB93006.1 hypothetical protein GCM10007047_05490 [Cerasicoccus arenae]